MTQSTTPLTTQNSSLWWLDEPGGTLYLLCDTDLDTLAEVLDPITPLFHWNADRTAKIAYGELIGDPEKIAYSLVFPRTLARKVIEQGSSCPGALIWGQQVCGRPDNFAGIQIGEIVYPTKKSGRSFGAVDHRQNDVATDVTLPMEAWPPLLDIDSLTAGRISTTEAQALNDVFGNDDTRCPGDCGTQISKGELSAIATDAAGGASAHVLFSTDFSETFAAGAGATFGNGFHAVAITMIPYGTGRRWIVGREGIGGVVQGQIGYSDTNGAAYTLVNIGGAGVGHGPTYGHGIFALDGLHMWAASNLGYIYKCVDNGVTWVAKETATIHAGSNIFVHFADKTYGIVGGAAGVISRTVDGGETWTAGGIPAASAAQCGWMFNDRRAMVGLANGAVYKSADGGLTWTLCVTGIPANAMRSMWFVNDLQGFLACNIGGVGAIYRTLNGGSTWEAITTPTNSGINSIWAPTASLVYAVGEANAATGFIAKVNAAYV